MHETKVCVSENLSTNIKNTKSYAYYCGMAETIQGNFI